MLKQFADRQSDKEPNSQKRALLKQAPVSTPTQAYALGSLLGANSAIYYDHEQGPRAFNFPVDHGRHYGFQSDWYFLVGVLHSADKQLQYSFVLLFKSSTLMGVKLLLKGEDIVDAAQEEVLFMTTSFQSRQSFNTIQCYPARDLKMGISPFVVETPDQLFSLVHIEDGTTNIFPLQMKVKDNSSGLVFNLRCESPSNTPFLQGDKGFVGLPHIGEGWGYYSYPAIKYSGTVTAGESVIDVQGLGWFDHQWGTIGSSSSFMVRQLSGLGSLFSGFQGGFAGWNWFGIIFENMYLSGAYPVQYDKNGRVIYSTHNLAKYATIGFPDGTSRAVKGPVEIDVCAYYTLTEQCTPYPMEWKFDIPEEKLSFKLSPFIQGQMGYHVGNIEFSENACLVSGTFEGKSISGIGWAEDVGYAPQKTVLGQLLLTAGLPSDKTSVQIIRYADHKENLRRGRIFLSLVVLILIFIVGLVWYIKSLKYRQYAPKV